MAHILSIALLCLLFRVEAAGESFAPANPEWNKAVEPFRIVGNVYYVGASGVSSFLITTPGGHILLDTGFRETVPILKAGIAKLGFRFEDIRLLLISHAHYDHAGGIAEVKAATKGRLLANPREAGLLARGGKKDFAFGDKFPFPPVVADGQFKDGEQVGLGGTLLTAHFTPGHTKGCTSYSARIREGNRLYEVVFPCSLTAPGYRLAANTDYPEIVKDFEYSFAKLGSLPCDVFLGGHPWEFNMEAKRKLLGAGNDTNPFVDPDGYKHWLEKSRAAFQKQLHTPPMR